MQKIKLDSINLPSNKTVEIEVPKLVDKISNNRSEKRNSSDCWKFYCIEKADII